MRKLNAWLFITLDGVIEAPEKWVMPDAEMFGAIEAEYAAADALLLGRRTYEVFAASWPQRSGDVPNADWMNNSPKYVASTTLRSPEWNNTTVLEGDVSAAIATLKQDDGKEIHVNGSAELIRSLLRDDLLDGLRLFLHPVVVGAGDRLFPEGPDQSALTLTDSQTYDSGIVSLTYTPAA